MSVRVCIFLFGFTGILALGQTAGSAERGASGVSSYRPITPAERLKWFGVSSLGPASLTGGLISAGLGTWMDTPHEYGPHWEGFGDRYGMRLTGTLPGNAMEAGLGMLWGEDPRYPRAADLPFKARVLHIVQWTFLARNSRGETMPAYSRYAATAGNNFLSNAWRESSEADTSHAVLRTGLGFLARMSSNAVNEFWPDVRQRVFHRKSAGGQP